MVISTRKLGYVVYTYPRAGLNAFTRTYELKTHRHLRGTHFDDDAMGMKIISIIRNPKDSVASLIAMNDRKGHSHIGDHYYDQIVQDLIDDYSAKMEFIEKNSMMVVLYEDFCIDATAVVRKVANLLGDELVDPDAVSTDIFNRDGTHVSSSRELPNYGDFVEYLQSFDFTRANESYERLASKHRLNL